MTIDSIRFVKYVKRVNRPYKYAAYNPSDSQSSQRLSKDSNYIDFNTKKLISIDPINIKVLRNL